MAYLDGNEPRTVTDQTDGANFNFLVRLSALCSQNVDLKGNDNDQKAFNFAVESIYELAC